MKATPDESNGLTTLNKHSVGSGEYCATVDAEVSIAMHGNAWHCSMAEDASGKDLCFQL
jgi:hypothetical protein